MKQRISRFAASVVAAILGSSLSTSVNAAALSNLINSVQGPAHQCNVSTGAPITFTRQITFGGVPRSVTYIVPASQEADCPAPVYVLLTYLGATPAAMIDIANPARLTKQYGAIIVAPAPVNGLWNDNPPLPFPGLNPLPDDVGFISAAIDDAVTHYGGDATRVVMSGLSDGALMASRFACVHPEKLLGAVMVGATELQTVRLSCTPSQKTSIITVLGTLDDLSPYAGDGLNVGAPGMQVQWDRLDGCATLAAQTTFLTPPVLDGTFVARTQGTSCADNTQVELYTIINGGHAWPGSVPSLTSEALFGITSNNFDATMTPWSDLLGPPN